MTSGKMYARIAVLVCLMAAGCGLFDTSLPVRQCYRYGDLKVLLRGDGEETKIHVYRKGAEIYTAQLLPQMPMIANVVKDTIYLRYFSKKSTDLQEGSVKAGDAWLKWTVHGPQGLIENSTITAAAWNFNNDRVEIRFTGAEVKLSFPLNNVIYDRERVMILSGRPLKSAWRHIKFTGDQQQAFLEELEAYAEKGILQP